MDKKKFLIDMLERSIATFAEAMLGFVSIGLAFNEIDWVHALSVSTVAMLVSILKCFALIAPRDNNSGED